MRTLRLLLSTLILTSLFFASVSARAQVSVNVSTEDPVYRDIDKLVAHGLVKKIIVGQRPYSRREIARIVAEAMYYFEESKETFSERRKEYIKVLLSRLKRDYREELIQAGAMAGESSWYSLHPLEKVTLDYTRTDSLSRGIFSNDIGEIDAQINPLLQNRQGRRLVDGSNLGLETDHWIRLTDYFAVKARPRFQLAFSSGSDPNNHQIFVHELNAKFWIKNFEVEIGRDHLLWGQGPTAGLILSNNHRGLDMIKISNDSPFYWPWVFKHLGPQKISFFYADLGPEQNFPHAYLTGYKWSLEPTSFFEFGAILAIHSGGEGSPPASFGERVGDIFPFTHLVNDQIQIGNKFGGFELRFRIPPARGLEIYVEGIADDIHSDLHSLFVEDAGYLAGIYAPRLDDAGRFDLRFEFHYTGYRYYRHPQFTSGWTLNRFILGDPLGPDSYGIYLSSYWDKDEENQFGLSLAYERRSNDIYRPLGDPVLYGFEKIKDNPDEFRYRVVGEWQHRVPDFPLRLLTQVAYERVQNFGFIEGEGRNNWMGRVQFEFDLGRWTKLPNRQ